ncbi:hypothetical protein [Streptomyces sp. NPDC001966]
MGSSKDSAATSSRRTNRLAGPKRKSQKGEEKPLSAPAGLLQAIARTNRPYWGKRWGQVVDFVGIGPELARSLGEYEQAHLRELYGYEPFVDHLDEKTFKGEQPAPRYGSSCPTRMRGRSGSPRWSRSCGVGMCGGTPWAKAAQTRFRARSTVIADDCVPSGACHLDPGQCREWQLAIESHDFQSL